MSNNLLELSKQYFSGDVVANLAALLGESPKNTESALHSVLPSLLASLAEKSGDHQAIGNLFKLLAENRHDGGILSNLGALSRGGDETAKLITEGDGIAKTLLGDKATNLIGLIANTSGIKNNSASSLLGFITPIVVALLGKNLKIGVFGDAAGLATLLGSQSGFIKNLLPAGFGNIVAGSTLEKAFNKLDETVTTGTGSVVGGISSAFDKAVDSLDADNVLDSIEKKLDAVSDAFDGIEDKIEDAAEATLSSAKQAAESIGETASQLGSHALSEGKEFAQNAASAFEEGAEGGRKFLPWLLLLAALALVWGLLKSCGTETETTSEATAQVPTPQTAPPVVTAPPVQPATPEPTDVETMPVEKAAEAASTVFEKALSTGYALKSAKDGFISKLVGFIESADPINKDLWFSMDGITFDTNKASIKKESDQQINDIAEIMKAYPKVKIKIGGYTDNTGNAKANLKLSNNRAIAVKKALAAKGVKADRMDAEGYGSDYPVASNDTEEGRQKNRRIDVRVTEK